MGREFDIRIYVAALMSKLWLIALVFLAGSAAAIVVAAAITPAYKATSTLLVKSQQIPSDLARSTVTDGTQQRIAQIRNQLTSRENLLATADRLGLVRDDARLPVAARVARVREALEINVSLLDPRSRAASPVNYVSVSYKDENAWLAARAANDFVSQIVELNLSTRIERAFETSAFFKGELTRIEASLTEVDARIAEFKKDNKSDLPQTLPFRLDELAQVRERIFEIDQQEIGLGEEKNVILEDLNSDEPSPLLIEEERPLTVAESTLKRLEIEYSSAGATYAQDHPRMRQLQRRMNALQRQVEVEAGLISDASEPEAPQPNARDARLKQRLAEIDRSLELLSERRAELSTRERELNISIERSPSVELELSGLDQRRTDLRAQYQEVVSKLTEAEIGEQLEVNRQAERFEIIERAEPPTRAEGLNRVLIVAAGSGASFLAGVGLVVLLAFFDRSLRTVRDLESALGTHAFAVVPYISTGRDIRRRWSKRIVWIAIVVGVVVGGAFVMDRFYMPLDRIIDKAAGQVGATGLVEKIREALP